MNLKLLVVLILIVGIFGALIGFGVVNNDTISSITTLVKGESAMAGLANSSWPMTGHDRQRTCQADVKGAQTNNTKWKFEVGNWIGSSPSIGADGTIYILGYNPQTNSLNSSYNESYNESSLNSYHSYNLLAINPDGSLKWESEPTMDITNYRTAPLIAADGTIYITNTIQGELTAINPDGSLKWVHKASAMGCGQSDPVVGSDGTIYYVWGDRLYAVNKDGSRKWMTDPDEIIANSKNLLAIGPEGTIYCQSTGGDLYAVNPDGSLKWAIEGGSSTFSPPSIGPDGTIYYCIGSMMDTSTDVIALKSNGEEKWVRNLYGDWNTDMNIIPPAIGPDGTLYIAGSSHIIALKSDGNIKWDYSPETGSTTSSTMVVDKEGTLYYSSSNMITALSADGKLKWEYKPEESLHFPPVIGPDGTIYATAENIRYLHAIGP